MFTFFVGGEAYRSQRNGTTHKYVCVFSCDVHAECIQDSTCSRTHASHCRPHGVPPHASHRKQIIRKRFFFAVAGQQYSTTVHHQSVTMHIFY